MARFWKKTRNEKRVRGYASGAVLSFNHDGLEIARAKRSGQWLPIWHVIFFVYLCLLVRLIAMAEAGPVSYASRMDKLENGSFIERAAAQVMHMDPVSRAIAVKVRAGLKKVADI